MCRESRRKNRCKGRNRAIHQPDESWLHILQNKETIAGLRFLGSRARRQNRALEIDRNFLVRLFGLSKIKQELANARIPRVFGRLLVEAEGLRFA
jgi:hypothetical protein